MTTTKKTITMSDRAPVEIATADWPTIATAKQRDGEFEVQAERTWWSGERGSAAGYLLASDDESETIRAIRRVAGVLDMPSLGDDCIADLPAEVLS